MFMWMSNGIVLLLVGLNSIFDGYVHNNSATIGFIIRNSDGHALLARAKKIGEVTITVAECLALRDGLAYMVHNGWGKVLVEGDSKIVIDCID
ncbi:hypothetical protein L3X38_016977 [Prunus dulcis]|nr:hypothetical protein L3X38_016977 [Prunus dulcis]